MGVVGERLEGGTVAGVGDDRSLELLVLVAGVDAQVVQRERGEGGAGPGLVPVGGGVLRVHGGQDLLDQAELVLASAGPAAGDQGLAQGVGVGPGGVEGVGRGGESVHRTAYRVDGGGVGGVDLLVREVLVGHRVQEREHLVQVAGVLAVMAGREGGDAPGHGLDMCVGHDGDQPRVPVPDEATQTAVGGDRGVGEEVGQLIGAQPGDAVQGAGGDARLLAVVSGGRPGQRAGDPSVGGDGTGRGGRRLAQLRFPLEALGVVRAVVGGPGRGLRCRLRLPRLGGWRGVPGGGRGGLPQWHHERGDEGRGQQESARGTRR